MVSRLVGGSREGGKGLVMLAIKELISRVFVVISGWFWVSWDGWGVGNFICSIITKRKMCDLFVNLCERLG